MTSDRPTPIGEHHYRDTVNAPPPDFDDDRPATLPPESAVRQCQWLPTVGPMGEPI